MPSMTEKMMDRHDDVELQLWPPKIRGSVKSLTKLLTGTVFSIAVIAFLVWHHYETDQAMWTQTFIVSHPEKERAEAVRKLPLKVQQKIAAQAARGD
jgi:hypothetical protein